MPEPTVDPTEWVVVVHRQVHAVIRYLALDGEDYWRVVTGEANRSKRRLVGYWGSLDEASHNALAYVEQRLPNAWRATARPPRTMTPQKPPHRNAEAEPP